MEKSRQCVLPLAILGLLLSLELAHGQYYKAGQIVTNNFTVYARRAFTNLAGQVFQSGFPVRLADFAGYVVFVEFFDPT